MKSHVTPLKSPYPEGCISVSLHCPLGMRTGVALTTLKNKFDSKQEISLRKLLMFKHSGSCRKSGLKVKEDAQKN
jgi:hypothetical protein